MDRGIPTEETLAALRQSDPPGLSRVGTPQGRWTKREAKRAEWPWQQARPGVAVKLWTQEKETYVFAQSLDRLPKERALRRRPLRGLWQRRKEGQGMERKRDPRLMKLGAARPQAPSAWKLVKRTVPPRPKKGQPLGPLEFSLRKDQLRPIRKREGRYFLRSNRGGDTAAQ